MTRQLCLAVVAVQSQVDSTSGAVEVEAESLQEMIMLQQTQSFGPVLILTQRHAQN
jgi:hypothetical protein